MRAMNTRPISNSGTYLLQQTNESNEYETQVKLGLKQTYESNGYETQVNLGTNSLKQTKRVWKQSNLGTTCNFLKQTSDEYK